MVRAAAEELGVQELLDQPLHTLSGGEKQRAALACLYVMESRCLLLQTPAFLHGQCFLSGNISAAKRTCAIKAQEAVIKIRISISAKILLRHFTVPAFLF